MSDRLTQIMQAAVAAVVHAPRLGEALLECIDCDGRNVAMGPWRGEQMLRLESLGVVEGLYARGAVVGWVPTDVGRRVHAALQAALTDCSEVVAAA